MNDLIITEKSNITAVADNIRALTGTTGALTLGQMATIKGSGGGTSEDLTAVLDTQETKLNELLEVLDGKAAGGGGTGEDLSAEIATQRQLISDIQTALEGKAAGGSSGGSVETCTVNVINTSGWANSYILLVAATVYENGAYSTKYLSGTTGTIENVVCGSAIVMVSDGNISGDCGDNNSEYVTSVSLYRGYSTVLKVKQGVTSTTIDFIV